MALTKLYDERRIVRRSDLCFDKGVDEIGGIEAVAPLWFVQEEKPKMIEGEEVYGRVREGIIVIPANYGLLNPSDTPRRAIAPRGLPLINPKEATQANRKGEWYAPDMKKYAEAIFAALINAVPIDERDVEDNILELMLNEFATKHAKYTFPLYGGKGSQETRKSRVENAGKYFREQLDRAGKKNIISQRLLLPSIDLTQRDIIGTQILFCGLNNEFVLNGDTGNLGNPNGVFGGVCD